ncbi:MAG: hypothetical protein Q8M76_16035, partial [Spirochaetaceae bacterium]|nr:hypothetical protein [Spirochaetaceae bacterium]
VDPAGNRSAEMPPIAVVVDRSSIYASSDAPEGGDGSPARPLRSLDAALALAARQGKRSVHLRGSFILTKSFESVAPIEIDGGFAPDWSRRRSERPAVRLASVGPKAALGVAGASLALRGIDISATEAATPVFEAMNGALRLEDCEVAVSAEGDALMIRAVNSSILIERSTMRSDRAMSFSGVQATRCDVRLSASSLSASSGVRFFGGFDLEGGSLELDGSLVESTADLGATLLALRASRIAVDRSLFRAAGGSGFFRVGSFNESGGEIGNSKFIVSWEGRATLFDVVGIGPAFRHDTIVAEGKKGDLTFFECSGAQPELWNCIVSCASGGGTLSKAGIPPAAGVFVADCVYGFDLLAVSSGAGAGVSRIATLAALNALNAGSAPYASKPCISEAPLKTFAASMKSVASLAGGSACVEAAVSLGGAYVRDFRGSPRPSSRGSGAPDIGADEVGE